MDVCMPTNSNKALKCPWPVEVNLAYAFRKLDLQPMPLSHLAVHMTADDMVSNEAKWDKSCYNKIGINTLDRA